MMQTRCWVWDKAKDRDGYGVTQIKRKNLRVHRAAYEAIVGPVPSGLVLDHLCRNRACYNPDHLEPVTNRENLMRGDTAAAKRAAQTHCKRGHEFTSANTYTTSQGNRSCRECRKLWS
jgi:hypothetical protein